MNYTADALKQKVETRLEALFELARPELLWESMRYSVRAGGKRLRPVLNLLAAQLLEDHVEESLNIACAIELIHTYSLIHDDLPALDNDTLRRGVPTNHVRFGEAQAILAGDGLLNFAYEVMLKNALNHAGNLERQVRAIQIVSQSAGVFGMIAGQTVDVAMEGKPLTNDELAFIHAHKTGDMITGALLSGLELSDPDEEERTALRIFGEKLGLAFQIRDDVLDVTAGEDLGKSRGKDLRDSKTTFVTLYGIDGANKLVRRYSEEASEAVSRFGKAADGLLSMAEKMATRNH